MPDIQTGRLSAARTDDSGATASTPPSYSGSTRPSSTDAPERSANQSTGQDAPPPATPDATELEAPQRPIGSPAQGLRDILEAERKRGEELREERGRWASQAERLALPGPAPASTRGWWPLHPEGGFPLK